MSSCYKEEMILIILIAVAMIGVGFTDAIIFFAIIIMIALFAYEIISGG